MRFNSPETRKAYSDRKADSTWEQWCALHLSPEGKTIIDIGCGGGIYSLAFSRLGAKSVIGIDQSRQYVDDAIAEFGHHDGLYFIVGSAWDTHLSDCCAEIVFERALIHHISEQQQLHNARECHRLLVDGGRLVVQDRTFDDVLDNSPESWIRSTLIQTFPRLIEFERERRPTRESYTKVLSEAGFSNVESIPFMEVRKRYRSFNELQREIMSRKGKSTLYQLNDRELLSYCKRLEEASAVNDLIESDMWTVWIAEK